MRGQGGPLASRGIALSETRARRGTPIATWLGAAFVIVALLPVTVLGYWLYKAAWDSAWQEVRDKHQVLARNLAAPVEIYVEDHRALIAFVAADLGHRFRPSDPRQPQIYLANALHHLHGFRSLVLVAPDGHRVALATNPAMGKAPSNPFAFAHDACFLRTARTHAPAISNILRSSITGRPAFIISAPVLDRQGRFVGVLLGELRTGLLDKLRANIQFGKGGHALIVDHTGHVIAHPNPAWTREMRDLTSWPIVQHVIAGDRGVGEFYSPFKKEMMVAAYAPVPGIGWGVLVNQPESEVVAQANALRLSAFLWALLGLALAAAFALLLTRWLSRPLQRLAQSAELMAAQDFRGDLPSVGAQAPREMHRLAGAFRGLVAGLQESRNRLEDLNRSLQARIDEATEQLQAKNAELAALAHSDHLTGLANRRHFDKALHQVHVDQRTTSDRYCVILIDIDHFKAINDHYGHAAGDAVLTQVAALIKSNLRAEDLAARYGGDEFLIRMPCHPTLGRQRAEELIAAIREQEYRWRGSVIRVTVSAGMISYPVSTRLDAEAVLRAVDEALYQAKHRGRDTLFVINDFCSAEDASL